MKKILCAIMILVTVLLSGCGGIAKKYDDSISELRDGLQKGSNESYSVEMISGYREEPFEIDGERSGRVDYTLITVTPKGATGSATLELSVVGENVSYSGTAVMHPYKQSYSLELATRISTPVTVTVNGSAVELKSVRAEGEIGYERALEVAFDELSNPLGEYKNGSKFIGEIFIRYVSNPVSTENRYYWYVAFIPKDDCDKIIAALIDPVTGRVEAKREA